MKAKFFKAAFLLVVLSMVSVSLQAQRTLLRKLQEKTEEKIVNEILGEPEESGETPQSTSPDSNNPSGESETVSNRRGGGLNQDAPDVLANISQAKENFDAANFRQAKTSVRNALWGVELEIGNKVLEDLPASVEGLGKIDGEDKVTSTGVGFVGMVIERVYRGGDDQQVKATIGNDSALLGLAGYYMADGVYMQSSDQPDQKQIQFQNHNAVIRYDEYDGYTLSVPFGQSSVVVINAVNFDTESQFMAAANNFDINKIKTQLGEK